MVTGDLSIRTPLLALLVAASAAHAQSIPPVFVGGSIGDFNADGQTNQLDLDLALIYWGFDASDRPAEWVNDLPEGVVDHVEFNRVALNWGNFSGSPLAPVPDLGVVEVRVETVDPSAVLPGHVTNDVYISFAGQYTGSQMSLSLTEGRIFHEPVLGFIDSVQPEQLFPVFPALEFDSFVANGGLTSAETLAPYGQGGGAVNLGGAPVGTFDDSSVDLMWFPTPGATVVDQSDFVVARITLSDEAQGDFTFLAFSNGRPAKRTGRIVDGALELIPEPASLSIVLAALLVLVGTKSPLRPRRRNIRPVADDEPFRVLLDKDGRIEALVRCTFVAMS